jgi:phosphate butyryltransferase
MVFKSFDDIIGKCKAKATRKNVALVGAEDAHSLEAILMASAGGIVRPVLIGDIEKIRRQLQNYPEQAALCQVIGAASSAEAAMIMVELVQSGEVDIVMKGLIQTAELMSVIVKKEHNLRTNSHMSHIAFAELPNYHKIICFTDSALNMYPDLEMKKQIITNAATTMTLMGYDQPKVAVLCAVNTINNKMPETVEAAQLKEQNRSGQITGCIIDGPISYDLSLYREAVDIKQYKSPVAADADILVMPNIHAGNIFGKTVEMTAQCKIGGFVVGAKAPIVLVSRSSRMMDKYYSIMLSVAIGRD